MYEQVSSICGWFQEILIEVNSKVYTDFSIIYSDKSIFMVHIRKLEETVYVKSRRFPIPCFNFVSFGYYFLYFWFLDVVCGEYGLKFFLFVHSHPDYIDREKPEVEHVYATTFIQWSSLRVCEDFTMLWVRVWVWRLSFTLRTLIAKHTP